VWNKFLRHHSLGVLVPYIFAIVARIFMHYICRTLLYFLPSDSTVSEGAGTKPRTVST